MCACATLKLKVIVSRFRWREREKKGRIYSLVLPTATAIVIDEISISLA